MLFEGKIKEAKIVSPEAQVMNSPSLTKLTNGQFAIIDFGLNDCWGGFGDLKPWFKGCGLIDSDDNFNHGQLNYKPSQNSTVSEIVSEVALLLTSGRLNSDTKVELENAYSNLGGLSAVQKLITTTPEFHSTGLMNMRTSLRPQPDVPENSSEPYKAVIFLNLAGGADTFNFLVPMNGCLEKDMYAEYKNVRTSLALEKSTLLPIDTLGSNQICDTFGLHPNLGTLQSLYNNQDLLFVSNVGVLSQYVTKDNWQSTPSLFAHNAMQSEIQRVDIFNEYTGKGMFGRLMETLTNNGYKPYSISTKGAKELLYGETPTVTVPSADDYEKFDPYSTHLNNPDRFISRIKELNKETNLGSSLFGETFSSMLHESLAENQLLYETLKTTTTEVTFPMSNIGVQLDTVARLIKSKDIRGTDRDVFYVEQVRQKIF